MMTRMLLPLSVADISSFAKKLKSYLDERADQGQSPPSHLELLNLLARATGMRNYQAYRSAVAAGQAAAAATPPPAADASEPTADTSVDQRPLTATARKALMQFDAAGRLVRLPHKLSVQQMAMWWMWTQFTVRRKYTEKEVNQILNAHNTFGDPATLRRELVNMKLLGRKSDCSEYWKEPARPADDVQDFLRALRQTVAEAQSRRPVVSNRPKPGAMVHATT